MALQEYKCPNCGGALEFSSAIQKMKCPFCDTEFEMEALEAYDLTLGEKEDDMTWDSLGGSAWDEGETYSLRHYVCTSCGGEIIGDENMAATSCPFCNNPVVVMEQFSGGLKPDYVIPFKLDKKAAKENYEKHVSGKRLLPKVFKNENHIDSITGIYVPFWFFDAQVDADIRYKASKVRTWSDANNLYTETSYYGINRAGKMNFENVPVDGSSKMDDTLMESLEPFHFEDAVDFQTAYLAGYLADKYDVDEQQSIPRANERIKTSTEEAFKSTVSGYNGVEVEQSVVSLSQSKGKYVLCPVWMLNTTWNGQKYTFAMNGQTGKFIGDLPVDKSLYRKYFMGIGAGVAAAVFAILSLFFS
ncbi:MAG: hypothetical protein J5870_02935 [Clostridia bacterium]|nr:hypothetical protein [Clostridia bacterium]